MRFAAGLLNLPKSQPDKTNSPSAHCTSSSSFRPRGNIFLRKDLRWLLGKLVFAHALRTPECCAHIFRKRHRFRYSLYYDGTPLRRRDGEPAAGKSFLSLSTGALLKVPLEIKRTLCLSVLLPFTLSRVSAFSLSAQKGKIYATRHFPNCVFFSFPLTYLFISSSSRQASDWEAKFYQIQSKYLLLLNELHNPQVKTVIW